MRCAQDALWAFCSMHAFFLLIFQTGAHGTDVDVGWRPWVLSLPGAMLNSMGGRGRIDEAARFFRRVARWGACALIFATPSSPAKVHGGSRRPKAAASGPDHGDAPSMLFAAFAMNPVRAKSSQPSG